MLSTMMLNSLSLSLQYRFRILGPCLQGCILERKAQRLILVFTEQAEKWAQVVPVLICLLGCPGAIEVVQHHCKLLAPNFYLFIIKKISSSFTLQVTCIEFSSCFWQSARNNGEYTSLHWCQKQCVQKKKKKLLSQSKYQYYYYFCGNFLSLDRIS